MGSEIPIEMERMDLSEARISCMRTCPPAVPTTIELLSTPRDSAVNLCLKANFLVLLKQLVRRIEMILTD
jgi:hypothetical protein